MTFDIEVINGVLYNGNFSVNIDAMPKITKEDFVKQFAGKFSSDINAVWSCVEAHRKTMEIHNKPVDESTGKPGKTGARNNG